MHSSRHRYKENQVGRAPSVHLIMAIYIFIYKYTTLNICSAQRLSTLCCGFLTLSGSQLYVHCFVSLFLYRQIFILYWFLVTIGYFKFWQLFPKFVPFLFPFLLPENKSTIITLRQYCYILLIWLRFTSWEIIYKYLSQLEILKVQKTLVWILAGV